MTCRTFALAVPLVLASCAAREEPAIVPPPARGTVLMELSIYADPARSVFEVSTVARSARALEEANVVQDDRPRSGPPGSVEVETTAVFTDPDGSGRCGVASSFCGDVTVRSFYPGALRDSWVELISIVPAANHLAINSDPPASSGLSDVFGLWSYGDLAADGGEASRVWIFGDDGTAFLIRGRVMAELCGDGVVDSATEACDDGNGAYGDGCEPDCTITPSCFDPALPACALIRASELPTGEGGNGGSNGAAISSDGRYIAIESGASNFIAGDNNGEEDVFVYDRLTKTFACASVGPGGTTIPLGGLGSDLFSMSSDGRFVVFTTLDGPVASDTNGDQDVFVRDMVLGVTTVASVSTAGAAGNGDSRAGRISNDGRFVAFVSGATTLVPGALDTNFTEDVFLRDRVAGTTIMITEGGNNVSGDPKISADGRFVEFTSMASNLVPGDTNGRQDAFVYDRITDVIDRVSVGNGGVQVTSSVQGAQFSPDGRFVAFSTADATFMPGGTVGVTHVYLRDRTLGVTTRVSVDAFGTPGNDDSVPGRFSADNRFFGFSSASTNLVSGDTNGVSDAFVRNLQTGAVNRILGAGGVEPNADMNPPTPSADGRYVAFTTRASNLVPNDVGGRLDSFIAPMP